VAEEIADRTIVYVLTRPVSRAGFFLGRWLAAAFAVSLLLLFGVAALVLAASALGVDLAPTFTPTVLGVTLLGGIVYCALFAALGTFLKHPMIVGLGYTFAMEGLLANLPGESQGLAIQHHLRTALVGFGGEAWAEVGRGSALVRYGPAPEAVSTLLVTLAVSLVLGCLIIRRKQYVLAS
jgi:ABC-2 type transport system permease protein